MKKIFKLSTYISLAIIFSLFLSGCGKKTTADPDAKKLVVWSFEDPDAWQSTIKSFQSDNKGYTLEYEQQVLDSDYESKVLNSILTNGKPDVWAMPNDWVYRHKDKLYPAPKEASKTIDLDKQYVPSVKESVYFDKEIYALTPSIEPLLVFYNPSMFSKAYDEFSESPAGKDTERKKTVKKLLDEPPAIWSDFIETAKLLTKTSNSTVTQSGLAMGTAKIASAKDIVYLLMMQNETDIVSVDTNLASFNLPKNTTTGANDIPGKRALDFYTSFSNPNSGNYTWNDDLGNDIDAFGEGKAAMIFGYSSLQSTLLQKYPNFKYKRTFAPQISSDSTKITDFARFNALGVSKYTKNPSLAWNIISIASNEEASEINAASKKYSPKKASEYDIAIKERTSGNPEKLALATAHSLVKGKNPVDFDSNIRQAITLINNGTMTSQAALDLSASQITETLRKDDW